jgi:hypothetical protein
MLLLRVALLFALVCSGCFVAPAMPPLTSPRGSSFRHNGASLAVGLTLPSFGSSYRRGTTTIDGIHRPRYSILALQMFALEGRQRVTEACDVGVQVGLGRSGGEFRCGAGNERGTAAGRVSVQWVYTEGVVTRAMFDTGYRSERGFLAFISTGLGLGAYYGRTVGEVDGIYDIDQLFYSPTRPNAVASQFELMWSSAAVLGVPLATRNVSGFWGVTVDVPLAATPGAFTPLDGSSSYSDLQPGVRVGVLLGISGILAR